MNQESEKEREEEESENLLRCSGISNWSNLSKFEDRMRKKKRESKSESKRAKKIHLILKEEEKKEYGICKHPIDEENENWETEIEIGFRILLLFSFFPSLSSFFASQYFFVSRKKKVSLSFPGHITWTRMPEKSHLELLFKIYNSPHSKLIHSSFLSSPFASFSIFIREKKK